jgi:RNA polymerase sigma factor (sigma-70 family)
MASVRTTFQQDVKTLFGGGSLAATKDGELLTRFLEGRSESGEQSFAELVNRHGPMVYRVCRQVVGDSHEAQDAFQAVFLVLARKAGSVRSRESLGSWLYGVALRVANRARLRLKRKLSREERFTDDLVKAGDSDHVQTAIAHESTVAVHHEVERLPEKYRTPILLCYLEGLTHDQAAAHLNWPVGTVRSRLARGRDQLRSRLLRRDLMAPAALGPLAGWIGPEAGAMTGSATVAAACPTVPAQLVSIVIKAACLIVDGKGLGVALCSAASLALTWEVLQKMALEKVMTTVGIILLSAFVLTVSASVAVGWDSDGKGVHQTEPPVVQRTSTAVAPAAPKPVATIDQLLQQLLEAARKRFDAQRAYYQQGRITLDRFVAASDRLMEVDLMIARTDDERLTAMERHVGRLKEIEARERTELEAGKGTVADVSEITQARLEAEVMLKKAKEAKRPADVAGLERRLSEVEAKLDQLLKRSPGAAGR